MSPILQCYPDIQRGILSHLGLYKSETAKPKKAKKRRAISPENRRKKILNALKFKPINISDLIILTKIADMTLRRDLAILERQKKVCSKSFFNSKNRLSKEWGLYGAF